MTKQPSVIWLCVVCCCILGFSRYMTSNIIIIIVTLGHSITTNTYSLWKALLNPPSVTAGPCSTRGALVPHSRPSHVPHPASNQNKKVLERGLLPDLAPETSERLGTCDSIVWAPLDPTGHPQTPLLGRPAHVGCIYGPSLKPPHHSSHQLACILQKQADAPRNL